MQFLLLELFVHKNMGQSIIHGSIPKRVKLFCKSPKVVKFRWDDIEVDDSVAEVTCRPTFVTDSENTKAQETAKNWAARSYEWAVDESGDRIRVKMSHDIYEFDNDPIDNVRLIGLDIRGNGGRAWQVLINDTYLFDMREDVLMDAILNSGIKQGGILNGQYIFSSVNSEMKIIRVGSLLHTKMIESTQYNSKSVITKLEIGGIYQNKASTKLYLGYLYNTPIHIKYNYISGNRNPKNESYNVTFLPRMRRHAFIEIHNFDSKQIKAQMNIDDFKPLLARRIDFVTSLPKSFKNKLSQFNNKPNELLQAITDKCILGLDPLEKYSASNYACVLNTTMDDVDFIHPLIQAELDKSK